MKKTRDSINKAVEECNNDAWGSRTYFFIESDGIKFITLGLRFPEFFTPLFGLNFTRALIVLINKF
jgi:hypothetical protein